MKKRLWVVLSMVILLFNQFVTFAFAASAGGGGGGASSGGSGEPTSSGGGGGISLIPEWVTDLMNKIDTMIENFNKLMSGELIKEMIDKLVIGWGDQFVTPLYGTFAKVFLFTPEIANIPIILKGWSFVMWICLAILSVSSLLLAAKIFFGKQPLGKMVLLFVACTIFSFYSLTVLHFINVGFNYITQKALESALHQTGVGYQGVTGADILKALVIGKDVFTNPDYQSSTLGQILVGDGGIFTLIGYIGIVIVPYFLVSIMKCIVLFFITIMINIWVVYVAFTGKYETLFGVLNLYARTLVVGFICSISWGWFVRAQQEYSASGGMAGDLFGIAPVYFAEGIVFAEMIFFIFFWGKPLFGAVRDPLHLKGGEVIKSFGDRMQKVSMVANAAGKRLGLEGLQRKSLDVKEKFSQISSLGKNMQQLNATDRVLSLAAGKAGGLTEVLQGVKYEQPNMQLKTSGSIVSSKKPDHRVNGARVSENQLPHMEGVLKKQGFEQTLRTQLPTTQATETEQWINNLAPDLQAKVKWEQGTGSLYLPAGEEGATLFAQLKEENLKVAPLQEGLQKDGVFVESKSGRISRENTEESVNQQKAVESIFPTLKKIDLSAQDANYAANRLGEMKKEYKWAENVKAERDGLWVPADAVAEALPIVNEIMTRSHQKPRIEAPRHSEFLGDLLKEMEGSERYGSALATIEYQPGDSHLYIASEYASTFQSAYNQYVKEREPYWQDKSGETWVIRDYEAIRWGAPPENGVNMGSFEELQKEMHVKHAEKKSAAKTSAGGSSKRRKSTTKSTPIPTASRSGVNGDLDIKPPGSKGGPSNE